MKYFNKIKKPKNRYALDEIESDEIILHHHLGMGDHITCNGLVNFLSEKFETIYLPVKEKNFKTVNYLYQDNTKIKLIKLSNKNSDSKKLTQKDIEIISNHEKNQINKFAKKMNLEILKVGHENFTFPIPESFYKQFNLSYSISKDYFKVRYDQEKNKNLLKHLKDFYDIDKEYSLVHCEGSTGYFPINKLKNIKDQKFIIFEKKSDIYNNLFFYIDVLKNAKEIHVVNSSVFCLADRLDTSEKLFFHNTNQVSNIEEQISFLKKWEIINY